MDGSEGRLPVGREHGRPAAPVSNKSLGDIGGWDPEHIQAVGFAKSSFASLSTDISSQGGEYAGLLTAKEHQRRKDVAARMTAKKAEIDADPQEYAKKKALEKELADNLHKKAEDEARQKRMERKRSQLAADLQQGQEAATGSEGACGGKKDRKKKSKKDKKAQRTKSLLSFGEEEQEDG